MRKVDPHTVLSPCSGIRMLDVQGFLRNLGAKGEVVFRVNPALERAIGWMRHIKADEHEAEAITGNKDIRESAKWLRQMGPKIVITTSVRSCGDG